VWGSLILDTVVSLQDALAAGLVFFFLDASP